MQLINENLKYVDKMSVQEECVHFASLNAVATFNTVTSPPPLSFSPPISLSPCVYFSPRRTLSRVLNLSMQT